MEFRSRRSLFLFLLIVVVVWFSNLEYRKLVRPDEGRYAEIPREMVASGDWVTPRLNDLKYFEKPALQYWATAASYELFGEHNWSARLWPALTGLLGILAAWLTGARLFGARAGFLGAAALTGSILYAVLAHVLSLDMGVCFFLNLAVFAFALSQRPGIGNAIERNWLWLAWVALGLAVLSKGLIGLVLPGAALVLYSLVQREFGFWLRMRWLSGLALLLLVTVPWFVMVSLKNPEFFHFFFIHEHFERFLTKVHGRYQPGWYFIPVLLVGFMPWVTLFLAECWKTVRTPTRVRGEFRADRFLLIWAVVIFGFFSASHSKLISYIIPLFPAGAILVGRAIDRDAGRALRWHMVPVILFGLIYVGAALWVPNLESIRNDNPDVPAYQPWLIGAALALTVGAIIGFILFQRERKTLATMVVALGGLICAQLTLTGHETQRESMSAWDIVQKVKPYMDDSLPFYSVNTYDQTLQPYLKRTTTMVQYKDELDFGIQQEPEKFLPTIADFVKRWEADQKAFALLPPDAFEQLQAQGVPMEVLARDSRRVIVRKPQP